MHGSQAATLGLKPSSTTLGKSRTLWPSVLSLVKWKWQQDLVMAPSYGPNEIMSDRTLSTVPRQCSSSYFVKEFLFDYTMAFFTYIIFFPIFFFRNANCSHCLNYGSFVVSWDVRKSESFNLVLFKDCVGSSCPLQFHINLWINLLISVKKK